MPIDVRQRTQCISTFTRFLINVKPSALRERKSWQGGWDDGAVLDKQFGNGEGVDGFLMAVGRRFDVWRRGEGWNWGAGGCGWVGGREGEED